MEAVGIHPLIINGLDNLCQEEQYYKVFSLYSDVPQRGLLSPILLILYTYELLTQMTKMGGSKYVPTTSTFTKNERTEDSTPLQLEIDATATGHKNGVSRFLLEKTRLLVIRSGVQTLTQIYSIKGEALNKVQVIWVSLLPAICVFSKHCNFFVVEKSQLSHTQPLQSFAIKRARGVSMCIQNICENNC